MKAGREHRVPLIVRALAVLAIFQNDCARRHCARLSVIVSGLGGRSRKDILESSRSLAHRLKDKAEAAYRRMPRKRRTNSHCEPRDGVMVRWSDRAPVPTQSSAG
jgi:hypothetical protein